jgi:hypothetical protein
LAGRIAARLERNLGVQTLLVHEDEVPVSETWEEGTGSDAVLVLLDSVSAPKPLDVRAWKGLTEHAGAPPVAFVRLEECAYPKLLERRRFFAGGDAERSVERWVVSLMDALPGITIEPHDAPFPEEWWIELADQPGMAITADVGAAHAFAARAAGHFQSVLWIGGEGREAAVIRAELEYRRKTGRSLIILAHLAKPLVLDPDSNSVLQVTGTPAPGGESALGACYGPIFPGWLAREMGVSFDGAYLLDEKKDLYRLAGRPVPTDAEKARHFEIVEKQIRGVKKKPKQCRTILGEVAGALDYGFAQEWDKAARLAKRAANLLREDGRRRESARLYNRLLVEAEERGDEETAAEAKHELSWLTEDSEAPAADTIAGQQMSFDLT